jgi:CDP-ribitol ribitolphosphotransferase
VVTTHGPFLLQRKRGTFAVESWHGFPLKAIGFMSVGECKRYRAWGNKVDFILSYSALYNTLMNACVSSQAQKFVITGAPRNDFLFKSNGRKLLESLLGKSLEAQKIVFYLPTFRESRASNRVDGERLSQNIFRLEGSLSTLNKFLDENKIKIVFKPHPEEAMLLNKLLISPDILLLTEEMLEGSGIDLYELLNAADALITDYSSVYFDYLLLDRPVIFIPTDLSLYRQRRGLLLEPYDFWTPGPKVYSYEGLREAVARALEGSDGYERHRSTIRDLVHFYQDGESSIRVWGLIERIIGDRKGM